MKNVIYIRLEFTLYGGKLVTTLCDKLALRYDLEEKDCHILSAVFVIIAGK